MANSGRQRNKDFFEDPSDEIAQTVKARGLLMVKFQVRPTPLGK
jgi:hypothetical protein